MPNVFLKCSPRGVTQSKACVRELKEENTQNAEAKSPKKQLSIRQDYVGRFWKAFADSCNWMVNYWMVAMECKYQTKKTKSSQHSMALRKDTMGDTRTRTLDKF